MTLNLSDTWGDQLRAYEREKRLVTPRSQEFWATCRGDTPWMPVL